MALTGTEYLRSVPSEALRAKMAGDYLVIAGGAWVSITDTTTMTTKAYEALASPLSDTVDIVNGVFFWGSVSGGFGRIEWVTVPGGVAGNAYLGGSSTGYSAMCGSGDYLAVGGIQRMQVSTKTLLSTPAWSGIANLTINAKVGTTIYNVDGARQVRSIDPAANSYSSVITTLSAAPVDGRGATIGNTVHFIVDASTRLSWDSVANTQSVWALTPPGAPTVSYHVPGSDGYLYSVVDSDHVLVVDPATGRWSNETVPTSRNRSSFAIASGGGKIWIGSSKPNPWP